MDKSRFIDLTKEEKEKLKINDFIVSERLEIINETPLSPENRKIAQLRFLRSMTFEAIAEKLKRDYKTIQRRISVIENQLNSTIRKII